MCPLAFKVKLILKRHMLIHTTPLNISCNMCSKKFRRQDDLDAHLRSHLQYRKFACTFCSQTFVTSGGLKSHIGVHNGLRPFRCGMPKCQMTFINTSSASVHRRTHLIGNMYRCDNCMLEFKHFREFRMHTEICQSDA
ncbi:Krueppel like 1, partial [Pseudolycoriella hygida]